MVLFVNTSELMKSMSRRLCVRLASASRRTDIGKMAHIRTRLPRSRKHAHQGDTRESVFTKNILNTMKVSARRQARKNTWDRGMHREGAAECIDEGPRHVSFSHGCH
jgi:hypothetical protein